MSVLKVGFIHKRELAVWFGLSEQYFMKNSQAFRNYCVKLQDYAAFEVVRGGIQIVEVYQEEYLKNIDFSLEERCEAIIARAPDSKLIKGGKIGTAPAIANEIIVTMPECKQKYFNQEWNHDAFVKLVQRTLRKMYGGSNLERYWVYYEESERIENESDGAYGFKLSVPLIKPYGDSALEDLRELTKEEEAELNALIREEEDNDEEHSTFQAYQIMQDVVEGLYKGDEKNLRQELRRQSKPFYRAMKRFNQKYGCVYINKGTIYVPKERG